MGAATTRVWLGALVAAVATAAVGHAQAAEVKVLSAGAVRAIVTDLAEAFHQETGHTVTLAFGTVGVIRQKLTAGEPVDVVIMSDAAIDETARQGAVVPGTRTDIARTGMGVAVREGAPKPDISTVEAFKQALLKAKSVGYIDPASGGSSGIYVAGLLDKLGIAEQIKPKAKLQKGGHVSDLVKAGEAEIGIHQTSEIVGQAGVTLVGPLPKDIQNYTTYAVGLGSGAKQAEAARAFIKVLTGPSAAAVLKTAGMEGA